MSVLLKPMDDLYLTIAQYASDPFLYGVYEHA